MVKSVDNVAVFWDYENCHPPSNTPGHVVVDRIREIAQEYGPVTTFKAYMDAAVESLAPKNIQVQADLQQSGVSLIHCPHIGKKDVVDKMMMVDMMVFALDFRPPATLVVITGDCDFTYCVSVLRTRGFRIVLVSPRASSNGLKARVDVTLDWLTDVLGERKSTYRYDARTPARSPVPPPTTWSANMLNAPNTRATRNLSPPSSSRPPRYPGRVDATPTGQGSFAGSDDPFVDTTRGSVVSPRRDISNAPISADSSTHQSVSRRPSLRQVGEGLKPNALAEPSLEISSSSNDDSINSDPFINFVASGPSTVNPEDVDFEMAEANTPSDNSSQSTLNDDDTDETPTSGKTPSLPEDLSLSAVSPLISKISGGKTDNFGGGQEVTAQPQTALLDPPPGPSSPAPSLVRLPQGIISKGSASTHAISIDISENNLWNSGTRESGETVASSLVEDVAPSTSTQADDSATKLVPQGNKRLLASKFRILIDVLLDLKRQGVLRPTWSKVAPILRERNDNVYAEAGFDRFKSYMEAAREAGIVYFGYYGENDRWVQLNNKFLPVNKLAEYIRTSGGISAASGNRPSGPSGLTEGSSLPEQDDNLSTSGIAQGQFQRPPPVSSDINTKFGTLIDLMRDHYRCGRSRVQWSALHIQIKGRDPNLYERVGAAKFGDYMEMATKANVIQTGRYDKAGTEWVQLKAHLISDLYKMQVPPKLQELSPTAVSDGLFVPLLKLANKFGRIPGQQVLITFSTLQTHLAFPVWDKSGTRCVSSLMPYLSAAEKFGLLKIHQPSSSSEGFVVFRG